MSPQIPGLNTLFRVQHPQIDFSNWTCSIPSPFSSNTDFNRFARFDIEDSCDGRRYCVPTVDA